MIEKRVRLTSTDSANAVNKDAFIDVEMKQHTKVFPFPSVIDTIDQREVFEQERENSTQYRLILTINPYCTNVLFNAVTEIVKNEGTDKPEEFRIAASDGIYDGKETNKDSELDIQLNDDDIRNYLMVRNTMYNNEGYDYHCGYDIFNNHILRNQSFKLVNPLINGKSFEYKNTGEPNEEEIKKNYNTIEDIMRYSDGTEVKLSRRTSVTDIQGGDATPAQSYARHLYLKEDVLEFEESINTNISEQNGWWGFYNRSSIPSCEYNNVSKKWLDLKISKVFNGKYFDGVEDQEYIGCEFIEMYPDSTLYSFNPKYNRLQNREEYNWDICITYPYENVKKNELVQGNINDSTINALLLADSVETKGTSGQDIVLFRSYIKHNLNRGDKIKLFYRGQNEDFFHEIEDIQFEVVNTGNLKDEYHDYYFYINDVIDLKDSIVKPEDTTQSENSENKFNIKNYVFRFAKVVNDRPCEYYFRKFRKLPNFKFAEEELTSDVIEDKEKFEEYITNNCRKNSEMLPFSKEQYPLAFSNTIYNDANTQVTFTDTIDLSILEDNLKRPLTELYITIIKRNKGHDLWYNKKKNTEMKEIEFSHCFGKVNSGLEMHGEFGDGEEGNQNNQIKHNREQLCDATLLTTKSITTDATVPNVDNENNNDNDETTKPKQPSKCLDDDITIEKDEFFGDVVELNKNTLVETVLSDVQFRFNTEQREHDFPTDGQSSEMNCGMFMYDEIISDDYDYGRSDRMSGFLCEHRKIDGATYRPEGYYYKAHYPIKVREFGSLHQGSHKDIRIASCQPRQANGMFIEVVSKLRTNVSSGDIVYLCDDENNKKIELTVNSVQSNVRFLLNKPTVEQINSFGENLNFFKIIEGLLYKEHTITEEDINNNYTWEDEDGNEHYATNIGSTDMGIESDEGKTVKDYSTSTYVLRVKNIDIPSYATEVAPNIYLWRDVLNVGHKDTVELKEYPFANGHFYINKEINFYLKRQDPFAHNNLYDLDKTPNDIFGNVQKTSNYEYKDEENRIC